MTKDMLCVTDDLTNVASFSLMHLLLFQVIFASSTAARIFRPADQQISIWGLVASTFIQRQNRRS